MNNSIEIEHLTKNFRDVKAVQDKVSGARRDLTISPVGKGTLALGYYKSWDI
ncbi:MAG: hypothetical protein ACI4HI_03005 [Lachnospiraceae bacterium]